MKTYCHAPQLPEELLPLLDVAYNYWWTTDSQARWLFDRLSNGLAKTVKNNPVKLLRLLGDQALEELVARGEIVPIVHEIRERMRRELEEGDLFTLRPTRRGEDELVRHQEPLVAYFSSEFGIHESLPIYSGGLGVLAGDHLRSAGDIGLPFVGVGLLYRQGYFHQTFTLDNWQSEVFEEHGFHDLPLKLVCDDEGEPLTIGLELPERQVRARIWVAEVGRAQLYLLDTYRRENWREDREITARLYDSDREIRLLQEIVLGVGGVRALEALNIAPQRFHMNEGHSAFLVLERAAQLIKRDGIDLETARQRLRPSQVFTTHTPVPAGHERFDRGLVHRFFEPQYSRLGVDEAGFMELGARPDGTGHEFEMTTLAIRFSDAINGVSRLHGEVAREQWQVMWPGRKVEDVPIGHVTNGIHTSSWTGDAMDHLYSGTLAPDWSRRLDDDALWAKVDDIDDRDLWAARSIQRRRLVTEATERAQRQLIRRNLDRDTLLQQTTNLDPDALTIGFARRFATYKRANLLFRHPDRLAALLQNDERPVQIIFAGKAHPADDLGKELLQSVIELSYDEKFRHRLIVLEDYDMALGRLLVQGSDIWLNTPRPPKEASGTSGMKATCNGGLTLSTKDGWWVEGFDGRNGWTIGEGHDPDIAEADIDEQDGDSLIELLENDVIPLFYDRNAEGVPSPWLSRVKASIRTTLPFFSTTRMVSEYAEKYYR